AADDRAPEGLRLLLLKQKRSEPLNQLLVRQRLVLVDNQLGELLLKRLLVVRCGAVGAEEVLARVVDAEGGVAAGGRSPGTDAYAETKARSAQVHVAAHGYGGQVR